MEFSNIRHGDYITELQPHTSMYKQISRPQVTAFGERDLFGMDFSLGWSLLTEPFVMVADHHKHDFDQIIFFMGGDPNNALDFDGEYEIRLGDDTYTLDYASCIRIPKGLMHCPLNITKVNKPFMFIDVTLTTGPSIRPLPDASKRD